MAREQLPQMLADYFLTISDNPLVLLLLINLLLLFLGTFIESLALLLLLVPFLVPVASAVGIDPVHFGVMAILNLMIGILTHQWEWLYMWFLESEISHSIRLRVVFYHYWCRYSSCWRWWRYSLNLLCYYRNYSSDTDSS